MKPRTGGTGRGDEAGVSSFNEEQCLSTKPVISGRPERGWEKGIQGINSPFPRKYGDESGVTPSGGKGEGGGGSEGKN